MYVRMYQVPGTACCKGNAREALCSEKWTADSLLLAVYCCCSRERVLLFVVPVDRVSSRIIIARDHYEYVVRA